MCARARLRRWAQNFTRFEDPEMEAAYQGHRRGYVLQMSNLCCTLQFLLFLSLFLVRASRYRLWTNPIPLLLVEELLPLIVLTLLLLAINFVQCLRAQSERLLCVTAVFIFGVVVWRSYDMLGLEVLFSKRDTLAHVWAKVQGNDDLTAELQGYIVREASRRQLTLIAIQMVMLFDLVQFIGVTLWFALTYPAIPVVVALIANLSPLSTPNVPEAYVFVIAIVLHSLCSSLSIRVLQRRQFRAEFTVQRREILARETQSLQDQMQRERALKRAAERADAVLNHILKNIMADASGCIYLFLESYAASNPWQLHQARKCLDRGMSWCRRREGILRMTAGCYTPCLVATPLKAFGAEVMQGHDLTCHVADEVVLLDPLACEIVLDVAITNAVRHGDNDHPVTVTIAVEPLSGGPGGSRCRVVFEVINFARPDAPRLAEDLVNRILSGEEPEAGGPRTHITEHLGLRHLLMAAEAHRMAVSLQQRGDLIILHATLDTALLDPAAGVLEHDDERDAPPLPPGTKIFCLDDSDIARRVLFHTFTKQVPGAVVQVFGETADEVYLFMQQALAQADIVVMDNHLAYGAVQLVGSELLRTLVQDGYQGLACIRSANVSDPDLALYATCGAHCVLGKDVPPLAMVRQISAAYAERARAGSQASSSGAPSLWPPTRGGTFDALF
eukprot:EG_transcript_4574